MADTTLQALDVSILPPNEGEEHAVLAALTGVATPFGGPDGQQVVLPLDIYRIPLGKQALKQLIEAAQAAHDALPDPKPQSNLVVPGSPADADRLAQELGKFR